MSIELHKYTYKENDNKLVKYDARTLKFIKSTTLNENISVFIPSNLDMDVFSDILIENNNKLNQNINIYLYKPLRYCRLYFFGSNINFYSFTDKSFRSNILMYKNSNVVIGEDSTSNGVRIITDNSDLFIGRDVMISHDIEIQTDDQHQLIDLETMSTMHQNVRNSVNIDDHVWLGKRALILKNVSIGKGSIVGAGSIVTKNVDEFVAVAGNPAKVIKNNISWIRSTQNAKENALFSSYKDSMNEK